MPPENISQKIAALSAAAAAAAAEVGTERGRLVAYRAQREALRAAEKADDGDIPAAIAIADAAIAKIMEIKSQYGRAGRARPRTAKI